MTTEEILLTVAITFVLVDLSAKWWELWKNKRGKG